MQAYRLKEQDPGFQGTGQTDGDGQTPSVPIIRRFVSFLRADRKRVGLFVLACVAIAFVLWQAAHWLVAGRYEIRTDNAYVRADITMVAAKVPGYVESVLVRDNQAVDAGDLLFTLESDEFNVRVNELRADYQQAVAAAERSRAQKASAMAALETVRSEHAARRDNLAEARARLEASDASARLAAADLDRFSDLADKGFYPKAALEAAKTKQQLAQAELSQSRAAIAASRSELAVAEASYSRAEQDISAAEAVVQGADAQVQAAKARLDAVLLDAGRTEVRAAVSGIVANRTVTEGQLLSPGQQTLAIVPLDAAYVVANFKETQVERMRPGQPVEIIVDAYPGLKVEGRVDSISPASGGQFSLIPQDTATGNFTKIVQRIPVRIALSQEARASGLMRPGLSVEAVVVARKQK